MSELVQQLLHESRCEMTRYGEQDAAQELKQAIEDSYVLLRFTETRGGTELGLQLDQEQTDISDAEFETQTGQIKLVGDLILDFVPVRCIAQVDLATLQGTGRLELKETA